MVDTNVGRLLARAVAGRRLRASEALALAERLLPVRAAREWNLAAMDFGSLVCRARPSCATCPLAAGACAWRAGGASEDPARGSAAVSAPQRAFEGSDRQGRGRLLRAACAGPIHRRELARLAGWPGDARRAAAVARRLVAEGLLVEDAAGLLRLPGAEEQRRRHPL
ncbi:MAG TPA: hypothetical protein VKV23_00985 [Acidimicrobiales bacterium]|nr:hypothetical protein [Acidimicrobiales bacterium]